MQFMETHNIIACSNDKKNLVYRLVKHNNNYYYNGIPIHVRTNTSQLINIIVFNIIIRLLETEEEMLEMLL